MEEGEKKQIPKERVQATKNMREVGSRMNDEYPCAHTCRMQNDE
jgi:hypothetical protein